MAMNNMNMNINGINPGAMNAMANGANGINARHSVEDQELKTKLNTYIYDYFLKNEEYDLARALQKSGLNLQTTSAPPTRRQNGIDDSNEDSKEDIDSKKPADLPHAADVPPSTTENSFLLDWFQLFWEMFWAPRKSGPKPGQTAVNYIEYQKVCTKVYDLYLSLIEHRLKVKCVKINSSRLWRRVKIWVCQMGCLKIFLE
jgi:hypothetical protein